MQPDDSSSGLMWLGELPDLGSWAVSFLFVRGTDVGEVFQRFGSAPERHVTSAMPSIPFPEPDTSGRILGRQAGDWVVILDESIPSQALRPEVLRRVSAGTEAVALYNDIGKGNHEFAHAHNSDIVSAVTTTYPPHWQGSQPERLRPLAEELSHDFGDDGDPTFQVLLALMEGVFGLSLKPGALTQPWLAAPLLPLLDDLPPERTTQGRPRTNDPVIDLLIAHVTEEALPRVLSARCDQVMAEARVSEDPVLIQAIRDSLHGTVVPVADDEPLGLALRTAGQDRPEIATMLQLVLAGRHFDALAADYRLHRTSRSQEWRNRLITDFGQVDVPADEMRAAEEEFRARANRLPPGASDAAPVAAHVRRLVEAGLSAESIASSGGITPLGVGMLLRGEMPQIPTMCARQILAIEIPPSNA